MTSSNMNIYTKNDMPEVSHRFEVTFWLKGIFPSPLDTRFSSISGLGMGELGVRSHHQGGGNANDIHLPECISYPPLVLERGVMGLTPLSVMSEFVLSGMGTVYLDATIMLMNHLSKPVCTWIVTDALPVKWQPGKLDATSNAVLINRIELVYRNILCLGAKI